MKIECEKGKVDWQLCFLVVTIFLTFVFFISGMVKIESPQKRSFEISHHMGFFRSDLENVLQLKIDEYATMAGGPARSEVGDEIDSLNDLLALPDDKNIIVKIYSLSGEAKVISDVIVSSIVVSSDTGWTLATISLKEEQ